MRVFKKMPSFQAVAAGQTAIANLPIGLSYHKLLFRFTRDVAGTQTDATEAHFASDIDEIRLIVDGDAKVTLSGAELLALNKYYGYSHTDGVLPLYFSRPWQRTADGEDALAYGTADVQTMTLEVDVNGAVTNPVLELYAVQGGNMPLGNHVAIRRFAYTASATGIREIADLPRGQYGLFAVHMATGDIDDVEVEANQRLIHKADRALIESHVLDTGRAVQAGYTHIDFAPTNRLTDNLPLDLQDFRLRLNVSVAGSFNILAERVEAKRAA